MTKVCFSASISRMLMIRLQRIGRKHEPAYRLVLTDSKNSTKSGRFLEILGSYDSRRGEKAEFRSDRITHWISVGAKTSDTVHNLLIDKKIITGKKVNKLPKKTPLKTAVSPQAEEAKAVPTEASSDESTSVAEPEYPAETASVPTEETSAEVSAPETPAVA